MISAVTDAAGAWSMRVMLPWTSACSTVATCSSGTLVTVPTGSWRSSSTEVVASGSTWTTRSIGLARFEGDLGDGLGDERGADLVGDLGGGEADGDRLGRVDGDLDLGRGLDQVALEVGQVGVVLERGDDGRGRGRRRAPGPRALTMTFRPLEVKPAASETWTS